MAPPPRQIRSGAPWPYDLSSYSDFKWPDASSGLSVVLEDGLSFDVLKYTADELISIVSETLLATGLFERMNLDKEKMRKFVWTVGSHG